MMQSELICYMILLFYYVYYYDYTLHLFTCFICIVQVCTVVIWDDTYACLKC